MKKIALATSLVLLTGALFAQTLAMPPGERGPGMGIQWKIGTIATTEYKKLTGQLVLEEMIDPVLKADGVEYQVRIPPRENLLANLKTGDTITVEGPLTTVKGDTTAQPEIRPVKLTINGKETTLPAGPNGRGQGGMMGRDKSPGRGPGFGPAPAIEWKAGVVVTAEYKAVSGTLALAVNAQPVLKVGGVDYQLQIPLPMLKGMKTGDTLALEGTVTTVKGDPKAKPSIQAFVVTIDGKPVDVRARGHGFDGDRD